MDKAAGTDQDVILELINVSLSKGGTVVLDDISISIRKTHQQLLQALSAAVKHTAENNFRYYPF